MELNIGRYDPTPVKQVREWFDHLWEESSDFDLASIYNIRFQDYDPYLILLRVLWELYGEELTDEEEPSGRIPLTTFQNEGINRAKKILNKYNGVLIADGVGLGKTFIGGELIREAQEDRRQRALLISPASLRDGTWQRFSDNQKLYMEKISYEQLSSHIEFLETEGASGASHLGAELNDYSLVVIDEAQAYRNPNAERAHTLRKLLQGNPPKKLVLMSATPVNNSLWDLYYLLTYFIQDSAFVNKGIVSLVKRFRESSKEDPDQLRPDSLFDILDEVTVRRTRNFIKRWYPNDTIMGPNGVQTTIKFPRPHLTRIDYDLESFLPGLLNKFEEKVMPEYGISEFTLARYAPDNYLLNNTPGSEPALIGLLRSALLKRLESSPYAFANTLRRMIRDHETFIKGLDDGLILTSAEIHELQETDTDDSLDDLTRSGDKASAVEYDIPRLKAAVQHDIEILSEFFEQVEPIKQEHDMKLNALVGAIKNILVKAHDEGLEEIDFRNKRKIILFSFYADTVKWIADYLNKIIETDEELAAYKGRICHLSGDQTKSSHSIEEAVFGFAPESTEAPASMANDRFDILITTDVLAEGQNLQQCRNVINYDLPWNPMRLVQRHGRIDRIGSPHDDVYIACAFPDRQLERLLTLEMRVRQKLARAAATIGVESEVVPDGVIRDVVFSDNALEIDALHRGETDLFENAGEDSNAYSGEEYRQMLRKGLDTRKSLIKDLPWAAGSGFIKGVDEGHFFCCKIGSKKYLRFIPSDGSDIITDNLQCLKRITCSENTPREITNDLQINVYDAWQQARDSVFAEWQILTDPASLQPSVRPLFHNLAEQLRKYPPTDVLQNQIDGAVDAIEAPHGGRIENILRSVFNTPEVSPYQLSNLIYEKINELGLQKLETPTPFPIIEKEEISLICWMTVSK